MHGGLLYSTCDFLVEIHFGILLELYSGSFVMHIQEINLNCQKISPV